MSTFFYDFTTNFVTDGKVSYVANANNVNHSLSAGADDVRIEATLIPAFVVPPNTPLVAGISNSVLRTLQGNDTMKFLVAVADPLTGVAVAIHNTRVSGNRGDDTIYAEATAGATRLWGRQAVVFGGAGNDTVTGVGASENCFVQMGLGDDTLSIGEHRLTNTALRWTEGNGGQKAYGVIRGGNGYDTLHFQHLSTSQFLSSYHALPGGGFTLGSDPTKYLEFEVISFNDGRSMSAPVA